MKWTTLSLSRLASAGPAGCPGAVLMGAEGSYAGSHLLAIAEGDDTPAGRRAVNTIIESLAIWDVHGGAKSAVGFETHLRRLEVIVGRDARSWPGSAAPRFAFQVAQISDGGWLASGNDGCSARLLRCGSLRRFADRKSMSALDPFFVFDTHLMPAKDGDVVALCSRALLNRISEADLIGVLDQRRPPAEAARKLLGGEDRQSVGTFAWGRFTVPEQDSDHESPGAGARLGEGTSPAVDGGRSIGAGR